MKKGKIGKDGFLQVERAGVFKKQTCRKAGFHPSIGHASQQVWLCGDDCPFFGEPELIPPEDDTQTLEHWVVRICDDTFLCFQEFEDDRKDSN